jgi:hypothetical protein
VRFICTQLVAILGVVALVVAQAGARELLDRVAITIGLDVITEQEIYDQLKIAAFLDGKEPAFTQQNLRETADRMVMQRLLLLDMRANGFPMPSEQDLDAALLSTQQANWGSAEAFEEAAREAGLDPMAIRLFLRSALATVRYIDFRFRPAVRVSEESVLERYMERFPKDAADNPFPAPPIEAVREALEEELIEESITTTIDQWIEDARVQAGVRYLPEVIP